MIQTTKRHEFLEVFLGILGAEEIQWTTAKQESVSGTVIYDTTDSEEWQDFIWYMREKQVPSAELVDLMIHLAENGFINGDKIMIPIADITVLGMENPQKEKLLNELFEVSVNMVDDGKETDFYFIHT